MKNSQVSTEFERLYYSGDMQILLEKTEWPDGTRNHIYFINRQEKMIGYKPRNKERVMFTKPLSFYRSRRKFHVIKDFGETVSKYRTTESYCTCKGFLYRKTCRHVNELREQKNGQNTHG